MIIEQWDIVRARINPGDKEEHPAVVLSPTEVCSGERMTAVNILYCSKKAPGEALPHYAVGLNSADGLDFLTSANCLFIHGIPKRIITAKLGRVSFERRRAICRKIREVWRWLN